MDNPSALKTAQEGKLVNIRTRAWGQFRKPKPNDNMLVKLPADTVSMQKYLGKGFTFIQYGEDFPIAMLDIEQGVKDIVAKVEVEDVPKIKQFICEICQKGLKTRLALAGHKRSHNK